MAVRLRIRRGGIRIVAVRLLLIVPLLGVLTLLLLLHLLSRERLLTVQNRAVEGHRLRQLALHLGEHL